MGTTVGLERLVVLLGRDLVFLVQEGRHVVTIGGLNAQGA